MDHPDPSKESTLARRGGSLGLRLFWTVGGNAAALFVLLAIVTKGAPLPSALDAVYWALVGLTIAARFVDVRRFGGITADGRPATLSSWRRFSLLIMAAALAAWGAAHGITTLLKG